MKRRKTTEKPEEIPRVVNACQLICNNIEIRNNEPTDEECKHNRAKCFNSVNHFIFPSFLLIYILYTIFISMSNIIYLFFKKYFRRIYV